MTEPDSEKPKTAAKAPRAPKQIDTDRLGRLAAEITEMLPTRRSDLVHRLETEEGMKMAAKAGATEIALAGVRASSTAGEHDALTNWANAARRAVAGGV